MDLCLWYRFLFQLLWHTTYHLHLGPETVKAKDTNLEAEDLPRLAEVQGLRWQEEASLVRIMGEGATFSRTKVSRTAEPTQHLPCQQEHKGPFLWS